MNKRTGALSTGLLVLTLAVRAAIANPQGPTVMHGQASFGIPTPGTLQIHNSANAIINWQSFSIGAAETTRFVQPSAASAVLNRVVGGNLSAIRGQLLSNGRVFLINPAGIVVGPNAVIDTAGLLASTLQMKDEDFLAGRLRFEAGPQADAIENHGLIHAGPGGEVVLIAPSIENSGTIRVEDGQLVLAAGRKLTLSSLDAKGIAFEVQAPEDSVVNLGELLADGGAVRAFAGTLRNRGRVQADTIGVDASGEVVLSASTRLEHTAGASISASGASGGHIRIEGGSEGAEIAGTVTAHGTHGRGGEVQLLGETVHVTDSARVDASGSAGGGRVLLGGERRDRPSTGVPEAQHVALAAQARIAADATDSGDGGEVVVWGRETAAVHGEISARGGAHGGDGGFVETSAGTQLMVTRGPSVAAPAGRGGTWLIDPDDIRIVAGDASEQNLGAPLFTSAGDSSVIGADLINAQLDFGSNVLITTTGFGNGNQAGNITVEAPLLKTTDEGGTTSLGLHAHGDVIVNAAIGSTGRPLSVALRADFLEPDGIGSVMINAPINTNGGSFCANAGQTVTINGAVDTRGATSGSGSISISGPQGVSLLFSGSLHSGTSSTSITTSAAGAAVSLVGGSRIDAGSLTIFSNDLILGGNLATTGSMTLVPISAGRPIALGAAAAGAFSLDSVEFGRLSAGGTLTIGSGSQSPITVGAPISLTAVQNLTLNDASYTQNANVSVPGFFTLNTSIGAVNVAAGLTAGNSVFLTGTDVVIAGAVTGGASGLTVRANTLDLTGTLSTGASGGTVLIEPTNFRPVDLGGADSVTTLGIDAAELGRISTTGTLQIGSTTRVSTLTQTVALAPAGIGALALLANGNVTQSVGATLAVSALRATSSGGSVLLNELNQIGTLSGSAGFSQNFSVTNATPLTVGSVGGFNGISTSSGTVTLEADNLAIDSNIFAGTAILKPLSAMTVVDLGGLDSAGVLGLSNADLSRVFASTLRVHGDDMNVSAPISWFGGSILQLAPLTAGRTITVGAEVGGTLSLTGAELADISASLLTIGDALSGPIATGGAVTRTGSFALVTGDPLGVTLDHAISAGGITVQADVIDFGMGGALNAGAGAGTVFLAPFTANTAIDLGGGFLSPPALILGAAAINTQITAGTLVVGDAQSGPIVVSDGIDQTQFANLSIFGSSLDIDADFFIDVIGNIAVDVAGTLLISGAMTSTGGGISLAAGNLLVGANVTAGAGNIVLGVDDATLTAPISATGDISIAPRTFRDVTLGGTAVGGTLSLDNIDVSNLQPGSGMLQIGNFGLASNINVAGPFIAGVGPTTTLLLQTQGSISQVANATISVPTLRAESFSTVGLSEANLVANLAGFTNGPFSFSNNGGPLTISAGGVSAFDVSLKAGSFTFTGPVSAFGDGVTLSSFDAGASMDVSVGNFNNLSTNSLTVLTDDFVASAPVMLPVNTLTIASLSPANIDIGGSSGSGTLGFDQTTLNHLSVNAGGTVRLGNVNTSDLTVSAPTAITSFDNLVLFADADLSVNETLSLPGALALQSDLVIVNAAITAGSVTIVPITANTAMIASPGEFNLIDAGTLIFGGTTAGAITLGGALAPPNVDNLVFIGASIDVLAAQDISVLGDLSFIANDIELGANATSTGGGRILFAPRTFRAMDLGTENVTRTSLTAVELARAFTSGTVQVGDQINAGQMNISAPISAPNAGALALLSTSTITQAAGATVSANNLRVSSFSTVTLNEANAVGTLAGSGGTFTFRSAQPLTVGTVDGVAGISASFLTLNADVLEILNSISASSATFAPATAGRAITLGAEIAGTLSLTDAELDRVSVSNLTIGNELSGPITVAAATNPANVFNLNLVSSGNTININAPLSVLGNLNLRSDVINILAALTSQFGSVTLRPFSNELAIVLGAKAADVFGLSKAEIDMISVGDSGTLIIGHNDAGAIVIVDTLAPPGADRLQLVSGSSITQQPGAPILVERLTLSAGDVVDLRAGNQVTFLNAFLSGTSGNDLFFNNVDPLRLQDIFTSVGLDGRVFITAGQFFSLPPELVPEATLPPDVIDLLLALEDPDNLRKQSKALSEDEEAGEGTELQQCS